MAKYKIGVPVNDKAPKKSSGRGWVVFWLIVSLVLLVITAYLSHKHTLTGLEARLFHDINGPELGKAYTTAAKWISDGLGTAYPIAACVIIPLLFKKFRLAWRFFVTAGGTYVLVEIIKRIIKEPRPVVMLHGHLHQRAVEAGFGFPSMHAAVATALALTLWLILPPAWRFVSVAWIVAVVWSRVFLGVHTPADVIGGFACGLLAVCIVRLLPKAVAKPLRLNAD